ncbi:MAG TPA: alpha/beta hydrolase [Alphaproteobacteria bacterium]|nr:alpha/beta hydrolase [Alphaproteobacteria bacterium]
MTATPLPPSSRPARRLARPDGGAIAYHKSEGGAPTVVFLTGLRSDMTGGKALALEAHCQRRGQGFLRFDYRGHGESSGYFEDCVISDWLEDTLAVLDALSEGPLLLVGSSLGGWLMLRAATARPARVKGLVGIAAAADFTEELMWKRLAEDERARLMRDGVVHLLSPYNDEPTTVTRALIEDGRKHLLLSAPIAFSGPVRLIHGLADADVPFETSFRIAMRLATSDVEIVLVKGGGHRLSEPADLARLTRIVADLSDELA